MFAYACMCACKRTSACMYVCMHACMCTGVWGKYNLMTFDTSTKAQRTLLAVNDGQMNGGTDGAGDGQMNGLMDG